MRLSGALTAFEEEDTLINVSKRITKAFEFFILCVTVTVIDDEMKQVKPRTLGNIVVK